MTRRAVRSVGAAALLVAAAVAAGPQGLSGQLARTPQGSAGSTWGGIALGGFSGTVFGLVGTMMPCNRTLTGARCTASGASAGAALGLAMGGIIGGQNQEAIIDRATSAGWGALTGAVVGTVLWKAVRQYSYADAAMMAAVGGAIGAAPAGAGVGAVVGAAAGGVTWWLLPDRGLPDFVMLTLVGVGVGGIVDWGLGANRANEPTPLFSPSFSIQVR
jgi:hypothetical protein